VIWWREFESLRTEDFNSESEKTQNWDSLHVQQKSVYERQILGEITFLIHQVFDPKGHERSGADFSTYEIHGYDPPADF
jgi:hypothetical protein